MSAARKNPNDIADPLSDLIKRLPTEPGVYLLKDRQGNVIYVGKALNLRARVRSYFNRSGDTRAFVGLLGRLLGDVETIVTHNAKEALLLENNLIKQHRPRFNVMMRDDKNYLVLRLDPRKAFPRLEVLRNIDRDGARYFGPYHSATSTRETLRIVNRYFKLRTCSDSVMASRSRACLQYDMGRCPAPCVLEVDAAAYSQQVDDVTMFLRGRHSELLDNLTARMDQAAETMDYEQAARLRDQINAIRSTLEEQYVVDRGMIDQDVFGLYREGDAIDFVVLNLREGKLLGRRSFSFKQQEFPDEELLSSFVNLYYDRGEAIPKHVLLPLQVEDRAAKEIWLSELRGDHVRIIVPERGDRRRLIELAQRNARSNFVTRRDTLRDKEGALTQMKERLRLQRLPRRIECFDISSLMGEFAVASMVVMQDGALDKNSYRRFQIRVHLDSTFSDDFSAIHQVVLRRIRRGKNEERGWALPDLIVIDGGKGQLSAALAAFRDAQLDRKQWPDIVALAKEREADNPDRVFLPQVKDPIHLRHNTAELFLLARLRDEAHRFAIAYHKKTRQRSALRSDLDDIPGIGPSRRRALLRHLGSLKEIRQASVDQLAAVPGMSLRAAEAVAAYFSGR